MLYVLSEALSERQVEVPDGVDLDLHLQVARPQRCAVAHAEEVRAQRHVCLLRVDERVETLLAVRRHVGDNQ